MQTHFTPELLADPDMAQSETILRACVHCGFCTATCPTYLLTGDELDSPRGRIYLIKDMLEKDRPADARTVRHIDRCLSCLSCMTTCPSSVHYMHLVDHARAHIEKTYRRPLFDRLIRAALAFTLTRPALFRLVAAGRRSGATARASAAAASRRYHRHGAGASAAAFAGRSAAGLSRAGAATNARRSAQRLRADRARHEDQ